MGEYINRDLIVKNSMLHTWKKADLLRAIKEAPTADVAEVLRCKDCEYRYDTLMCPLRHAGCCTTDESYCSRGKRKLPKGV